MNGESAVLKYVLQVYVTPLNHKEFLIDDLFSIVVKVEDFVVTWTYFEGSNVIGVEDVNQFASLGVGVGFGVKCL